MPVRAQPVAVWLQEDVVNGEAVVWQFAQFVEANVLPAAECTGLFVVL